MSLIVVVSEWGFLAGFDNCRNEGYSDMLGTRFLTHYVKRYYPWICQIKKIEKLELAGFDSWPCSLAKIFKKNWAIWWVLVYILIWVCLETFSKISIFYMKNYDLHSCTLTMWYLAPGKMFGNMLELMQFSVYLKEFWT